LERKNIFYFLPLPKGKGEVRRGMGIKNHPLLNPPPPEEGEERKEKRNKEKERNFSLIIPN